MIKKGYLLQITTWENDGDNYKAEQFDGLSLKEARLYIEVCKLFKGCSDINNRGFGNADNDGTFENKFLPYFKAICEELTIVFEDDPLDLVYELIGYWCEGEYLRNFESYKLYYIEDCIVESKL